MKRWLIALPFDLFYLTILGYGLFGGVKWAKNIGLFASWFLAIALLLIALTDKEGFKKRFREKGLRPKLFMVWDVATDVAPVLMLAASEYFVLAAVLAVAHICRHNLVLEAEEELRHEKQKARPQDPPTQET